MVSATRSSSRSPSRTRKTKIKITPPVSKISSIGKNTDEEKKVRKGEKENILISNDGDDLIKNYGPVTSIPQISSSSSPLSAVFTVIVVIFATYLVHQFIMQKAILSLSIESATNIFAMIAAIAVGFVFGYFDHSAWVLSMLPQYIIGFLTAPRVKELWIHPLKSGRAISVNSITFDRLGVHGDRRWMIVAVSENPDENFAQFLSQRMVPKMALIEAKLNGENLILSAPSMVDLIIKQPKKGKSIPVQVWDNTFDAQLVESADDWLAEFFEGKIKATVRLVTTLVGEHHTRKLKDKYLHKVERAVENISVGFADGFPVLITSIESLNNLNDRMKKPISMRNFRPNIVLEGCFSFQEDTWRRIRIGDVVLDLVKPCPRCTLPSVDPDTGVRNKAFEPLKTLRTFRQDEKGEVNFGINAIHRHAGGMINVGDVVEVIL